MQNFYKWLTGALAVAVLAVAMPVRAADASQSEIESLRKEMDALRKQINSNATPKEIKGGGTVDKAVAAKYGPNNAVTTKAGKLSISGLLQVWYYSIENDQTGLFESVDNDLRDTNDFADNDSFRIRRSEIKFTVDIHENIQAVVMIDPAREATSFPNVSDNKSHSGVFKRRNQVAVEVGGGDTGQSTNVQTGAGGVPRLLQDAYILYHGVVPHHDFQIGQYKPYFGEEGIRSSGALDFVERSYLGQIGDARDIGATILGKWWDERFQYQLGIFNAPGNYWGSGGQQQNRSDDNDEKDIYGRLFVRPVWKQETWGSLELGYSFRFGTKGEEANADPVGDPVNGLNRNETSALSHNAWMSYMAGGPVKGLWLRSEYLFVRDRHAPSSVVDTINDPGTRYTNNGTFSGDGFYVALGYKIGDSTFKDCAPSWLKGFEFAARFDRFENVHVNSATGETTNSHTRTFHTDVYTAGINYYIKGNNAKIQLNYNIVDNPDSDSYFFKDNIDNNSLVVNFQVSF